MIRILLAAALALCLVSPVAADDLKREAKVTYRLCWCLKLDTWTCQRKLVHRTCWEIPLCRDPQPVGDGEAKCWQRRQAEGGPLAQDGDGR